MFNSSFSPTWVTQGIGVILNPSGAVEWLAAGLIFIPLVLLLTFGAFEWVVSAVTGSTASSASGGAGGRIGGATVAGGGAVVKGLGGIGRSALRTGRNSRAMWKERPRTLAGWSYMVRRSASDRFESARRFITAQRGWNFREKERYPVTDLDQRVREEMSGARSIGQERDARRKAADNL